MVVSFADRDTAGQFSGKKVRRFANLITVAERKLQQLASVMTLDALRVPPRN